MPTFDPQAPTAMFIGRYQPFHDGHKKLIEEGLRRVGQACIAVRDTHGTDAKNPLPFHAVKARIESALWQHRGGGIVHGPTPRDYSQRTPKKMIAAALLGSSSGLDVSLGSLTPGLLAAYGAFWILGFILYALIYAAAGSLVSRAEDLQVLALPLSIIAIGGYIQAVMALSGGISSFIRISSYVPFWSPFVMLTRLTIGRVEPWELVLSFGLLAASIPIVGFIAVRVYSAGVLLYGQRPGARQIVGAIISPPV